MDVNPLSSKGISGQSSMMEYLLLSFFVLATIIVMIFFLTGWQFSQFNLENQKIQNTRVINLQDSFINSQIFVNENSVFDDAKLTSIQSFHYEACEDLAAIFGSDWYIEIQVLNPFDDCSGLCSASTYPCCGRWEICTDDSRTSVNRNLPVNVYRKSTEKTELAVLKVGVFTD